MTKYHTSQRSICFVAVIDVVFTTKAVPVSAQHLLISELIQLMQTSSWSRANCPKWGYTFQKMKGTEKMDPETPSNAITEHDQNDQPGDEHIRPDNSRKTGTGRPHQNKKCRRGGGAECTRDWFHRRNHSSHAHPKTIRVGDLIVGSLLRRNNTNKQIQAPTANATAVGKHHYIGGNESGGELAILSTSWYSCHLISPAQISLAVSIGSPSCSPPLQSTAKMRKTAYGGREGQQTTCEKFFECTQIPSRMLQLALVDETCQGSATSCKL